VSLSDTHGRRARARMACLARRGRTAGNSQPALPHPPRSGPPGDTYVITPNHRADGAFRDHGRTPRSPPRRSDRRIAVPGRVVGEPKSDPITPSGSEASNYLRCRG
jgi:hypothetical protein